MFMKGNEWLKMIIQWLINNEKLMYEMKKGEFQWLNGIYDALSKKHEKLFAFKGNHIDFFF